MTTRDLLSEHIEGSACALGFTLEEAWRPTVRANLEVSLKFARRRLAASYCGCDLGDGGPAGSDVVKL